MARPAVLTPLRASAFARLALSHVSREYPNKLDHVLRDDADLLPPRTLHPIFFGSFDWHSCVHGYWLLATVLRRFPTLAEAPAIRSLFDARLTPPNVDTELSYLGEALRAGFERPYGWAWLLMLAAELRRHESEHGRRWAALLQPLTDAFVERFRAFLPKATYPVRAGTHFNTAFALRLTTEYAEVAGDLALASLCRDKALAWYADDHHCQAWEPSGDDFLSSALMEAECMRVMLARHAFSVWLSAFLPRLASREPATLFTPATVSDRADGKIAHLDGLNLSRAWCWRALAGAMGGDDVRRTIALETAEAHIAASLPHVSGDYAGEHWLATFAVLALSQA
jgi:hypothetical protein